MDQSPVRTTGCARHSSTGKAAPRGDATLCETEPLDPALHEGQATAVMTGAVSPRGRSGRLCRRLRGACSGRVRSASTDDRLTLASGGDCESAEVIVRETAVVQSGRVAALRRITRFAARAGVPRWGGTSRAVPAAMGPMRTYDPASDWASGGPRTFVPASLASVLKASAIRVSSGSSAERSKSAPWRATPARKRSECGHDHLPRSAKCGERPSV